MNTYAASSALSSAVEPWVRLWLTVSHQGTALINTHSLSYSTSQTYLHCSRPCTLLVSALTKCRNPTPLLFIGICTLCFINHQEKWVTEEINVTNSMTDRTVFGCIHSSLSSDESSCPCCWETPPTVRMVMARWWAAPGVWSCVRFCLIRPENRFPPALRVL